MSQFAKLHSTGLWWYRRGVYMTDPTYSAERLPDGQWELWHFGPFGAYPSILPDDLIDHQITDVWEADLEKGWEQ